MSLALDRFARPGRQPWGLGMGASLGLHLLLAAGMFGLSLFSAGPVERPELVQNVKLVELPPPPPPPRPQLPPPQPQQPPTPPPRTQPRLPPRVQHRPPSTTRPSPVFSAAQEHPVPSRDPGLDVQGEAIGQGGPPAAPAGGGPLPQGQEEVPAAAVDLGPYTSLVRSRIERNKQYPRLARQLQQEGRVTLVFIIDERGRVVSLRVVNSSGVPSLDQAASEAVKGAAPFPVLPGAPAGGLRMELTIVFELS